MFWIIVQNRIESNPAFVNTFFSESSVSQKDFGETPLSGSSSSAFQIFAPFQLVHGQVIRILLGVMRPDKKSRSNVRKAARSISMAPAGDKAAPSKNCVEFSEGRQIGLFQIRFHKICVVDVQ